MSTAIGAEGHFGYRLEGSFGSGGAVEYYVPILSEDVQLIHANVYSDRIANTAAQVGGQSGNKSVTGTIELPICPQTNAAMWRAILGQETSPFYMERPLKSLAIEVDRSTDAILASGCMVSSAAVSSNTGGEVNMSLTLEGMDLNDTTATSPSYTSGDSIPYLHSDGVFTLDGTEDTSITAWSLNIDNSLVTDLYGTQKIRLDIPAGKGAVTGSFTKLFDDTTERDKFLTGDVVSFKAKFSRGSNDLVFWIPKAKYDSRPSPMSGQSEYILETFNFTAYVDDPDTEQSLRISGDVSA